MYTYNYVILSLIYALTTHSLHNFIKHKSPSEDDFCWLTKYLALCTVSTFIVTFVKAHILSLFGARLIQYTSFYPISLWSIWILSFHISLHLCVIFRPKRHMLWPPVLCPAHFTPSELTTLTTLGYKCRLWISIALRNNLHFPAISNICFTMAYFFL